MKYRALPVEVHARRWSKTYDHPNVQNFKGRGYQGLTCARCREPYSDHGWIDATEDGQLVCPCDWIIIRFDGVMYALKDKVFRETYEPVDGGWPED